MMPSKFLRPTIGLACLLLMPSLSTVAAQGPDARPLDAYTPDTVRKTVSSDRGRFDVELNLPVALTDARYVTTDLHPSTTAVINLSTDDTDSSPYDNLGVTHARWIDVAATPAGEAPTAYRLFAFARQTGLGDMGMFIGVDSNGNGVPEPGEELCRDPDYRGAESCQLAITSQASASRYWVLLHSRIDTTQATLDTTLVPLRAGPGLALVATGPGRLGAGEYLKLRASYNEPRLTQGERRIGFILVQSSPGVTVKEIPVWLERNNALIGRAVYALSPGVPLRHRFGFSESMGTIFVDVPPGSGAVTFRTGNGSGNIQLLVGRRDIPDGPAVDAAPSVADPGVVSSGRFGVNHEIRVAGDALQPGRWYVHGNATHASGQPPSEFDLTVEIEAGEASPALKPGSYYNALRPGHGVFFYPSGPDFALLWYTYTEDSMPTWYYAQGPRPGPDGIWSGKLYRSLWNGDANHLVQVGSLVLSPTSADTFSMAYNIEGATGAEPMQPLLTGCPSVDGAPLDASTHWFDPARPGYGYSLQVNPNYEFFASFVYDTQGNPRFLVAERGGAFDASQAELDLELLTGSEPLALFHYPPQRTRVGTLVRGYAGGRLSAAAAVVNSDLFVPMAWEEAGDMAPLSSTQGCAP